MAYGYGDYGGFAPYVSVAERRRRAAQEMERLRAKGHPVAPVTIEGRKIATSFWGKAWCTNLEGYADYASRLGRGRSYVRNGSVVDLQVAAGTVTARVAGSELYRINVVIEAVPAPRWAALRRDCAGGIDSLVELLQGRLSQPVMERICRRAEGLFPTPREIAFDCSCPDSARMCKHVAAVLYGIGARLDHAPELLFTLRAVDHRELIAGVAAQVPRTRKPSSSARVLADDGLADLFGLDLASEPPAPTPAPPAAPAARVALAAAAVATRTRPPAKAAAKAKAAAVAPKAKAAAVAPKAKAAAVAPKAKAAAVAPNAKAAAVAAKATTKTTAKPAAPTKRAAKTTARTRR